jgi:ribosomal protein S6
MDISFKHQSPREFNKNSERIQSMVDKYNGDVEKQTNYAKTQAYKITKEEKAFNRAMVAKQMGHIHLFEVFFKRAYELGSVSKQDYRSYKLEKLGI